MRLLLDTHLLLWAAARPERLPPLVAAMIEDNDNNLMFSAASIWETAIKHAQGRRDFPANPRLLQRALLDSDYQELPITAAHAIAVGTLPPIHKDPFDRILAAQALVEGITLLTADPILATYPAPIRLV